MASRLILTVESATPEQVAAAYKKLDLATAGPQGPEIEIFVQHALLEGSPVSMPADKPLVGLDGKPAVPLPTTSGLAST